VVSLGSQSDVFRKCEDAGKEGVSCWSGGRGGLAAGFSVSQSAVACARFRHWRERRVGVACARVCQCWGERSGVWRQVESYGGWPGGKSGGGLCAVFVGVVCVHGVWWFHWRDRQCRCLASSLE
jgi:hypothetical protein